VLVPNRGGGRAVWSGWMSGCDPCLRWWRSRAVQPVAGALGVYAGGSLASVGFQPGRSDLDLVAVVAEELDGPTRTRLVALHRDLRRTDPTAGELHCVYVPRRDVHDVVLDARRREPLVSMLDRRAAQSTPDLVAGGGRFRPGR
jgi:hypothetical protein